MQRALDEATAAAERGEVPVGAVLVSPDGAICASAGNQTLADRDPSAHAEMLAIRKACAKVGSERLPGFDLYVTLEPCAMCAALISYARIRRLYFGASDPKSGGLTVGPKLFSQPTLHHRPEVYGGIMEREASELLKDFFQQKRAHSE